MAAHKLDQLFKKKLNKHLSEPSDEAWAKMEAMLDQPAAKPTWFYYKVAAVITLFMTVGWITYEFQFETIQKNRLAETVQEVPKEIITPEDHLIPESTLETEPIKTEKKKPDPEVKSKLQEIENLEKKQVAVQTQKVISNEHNLKEEASVVIEPVNVNQEMLAINEISGYSSEKLESIDKKQEEQEKVEAIPEKKRKPIRIIYKRGKRKAQPQTMLAESDTTNRKKFNFNSIIDATKNITSGDLLADIRDAKNDFFSQGLDFKKSERSKNENSNK